MDLSVEDAIGYALNEKPHVVPSPAKAEMTLTHRERQVAELVAQGLSNNDIAARLVISRRTAEAHVEHMLLKLGFTSRAQIAAWVTQRSPED
jgi:DNA-binding NarL/FixJ family response regulator